MNLRLRVIFKAVAVLLIFLSVYYLTCLTYSARQQTTTFSLFLDFRFPFAFTSSAH